MKIITPFLGAVSALCAFAIQAGEIPVTPPAKAGLDADRLAYVDQFMHVQVAAHNLAGASVMIWHAGKIGFFHTYGMMDVDAQKPMTGDAIFRIYSMTKAITTAAALNLYDAGKLGLDDPVSKYIPSFAHLMVADANGLRPPSRPVTIRDLMLHIAGLTSGAGPEACKEAYNRLKPMDSLNLEEMVAKMSQVPLAFDPGTDWMYGRELDVLGRVIEIVSGKPLDEFFADTIFIPLDMEDTAFSVPPEKLDRFVANYSRTNGLKVIDAPATSKFAKKVTLFSGGGGLVSTARDYMRFLVMIKNGGTLDDHRILRENTVKLMSENLLPEAAFPIHFGNEKRFGTGFGLGFAVCTKVTSWDRAAHVGEFGWDGAASTHYWISPADKLIVVTLEQIMPYEWDTERGIKHTIYAAIRK